MQVKDGTRDTRYNISQRSTCCDKFIPTVGSLRSPQLRLDRRQRQQAQPPLASEANPKDVNNISFTTCYGWYELKHETYPFEAHCNEFLDLFFGSSNTTLQLTV